jgi:hypothetical protein
VEVEGFGKKEKPLARTLARDLSKVPRAELQILYSTIL